MTSSFNDFCLNEIQSLKNLAILESEGSHVALTPTYVRVLRTPTSLHRSKVLSRTKTSGRLTWLLLFLFRGPAPPRMKSFPWATTKVENARGSGSDVEAVQL